MNSKNNVVLDFTQTNSPIDIAVMPASVAQRALQALAEKCSKTNAGDIMQQHIAELRVCRDEMDYTGFIGKSADFVQERALMDNIQAGNWDAYKVAPLKPGVYEATEVFRK